MDLNDRRDAINAIAKYLGRHMLPEQYGLWMPTASIILEHVPSALPEQIARDIATIIENEQDMRVVLKNAEQRWIPVTEKAHPDTPISVQVQMNNGWIITAYHEDGVWHSVPDCEDALQDDWIEAWRELPEPYQEGVDE